MKILSIKPKSQYILEIQANNGITGLFDLSPYLSYEVFRPLRDQQEFEKVHNGEYFVEWDCGADLSLDTIAAQLTEKQ